MTTNSPTDQEETELEAGRVSPDTVFTLLSHPYRRVVLDLLLTHDRAFTLRDLQNEIVETKYDMEITEVDDGQIKQTVVELYHIHIPKLADSGIITYDEERELVEPTEKLSELKSFLGESNLLP